MIALQLDGRRYEIRRRHLELLDNIRNLGSLTKASKALGITYKTGLSWIKSAETSLKSELVIPQKGGVKGGGSLVTEHGLKVIETYYKAMTTLNAEFTKDFLELKMSARNALEGKVSNVKYDHEICLVEIQLETPQTVKAVITTDSAKRLEIKRGAKMFAVIKATEVMVAR